MTGRLQNGTRRLKPAAVLEHCSLQRAATVTTEHSLRTHSWTADVRTMETAIRRFVSEQPLANDCQVVMFEIAGDHQLHVNVIHQLPHTAVARGWSGPGRLRAGSVYNRRFCEMPASEILRHIREMVFA